MCNHNNFKPIQITRKTCMCYSGNSALYYKRLDHLNERWGSGGRRLYKQIGCHHPYGGVNAFVWTIVTAIEVLCRRKNHGSMVDKDLMRVVYLFSFRHKRLTHKHQPVFMVTVICFVYVYKNIKRTPSQLDKNSNSWKQ